MPQRSYTVFMLLKASPHWQQLDRPSRLQVQDDALMRIYEHFPSVRMSCFDATSFHGRCTDVLVWETTDMAEYFAAVESLREAPFFMQPYFEIVDVIPSVPDSWREFDPDLSLTPVIRPQAIEA